MNEIFLKTVSPFGIVWSCLIIAAFYLVMEMLLKMGDRNRKQNKYPKVGPVSKKKQQEEIDFLLSMDMDDTENFYHN